MQAGVQLYFHAGADFVIDGNLMSIGTKEWPVLMRGDRFDTMADVDQTPYDYLPSQWGSLYLQNPQGDHQLIHTHIRGADLGVLLVGGNRSKPKLTLQNVRIHTMGTYGVDVQNGDVLIENSELSNCGEGCLLLLGGSAHVVHSTIANYMPWKSRSGKALTVANYVNSQGYITAFPVERAVFENSIIYGSLFDELLLQADTTQSSMFNVVFSHCLIKSKQLSLPYFHDVVWSNVSNGWGNDTVFVNTTLNKEKGYFNFELSEQSHARGRANRDVASRYPLDFYDKSRLSDGAPDIGAYEY